MYKNKFDFSSDFYTALEHSKRSLLDISELINLFPDLSNDEKLYLKMDLAVRNDKYSLWNPEDAQFDNPIIQDLTNCYYFLFINPLKALTLSNTILLKYKLADDLEIRVRYWKMDCHFLTGNSVEGLKDLESLEKIQTPIFWKPEILAVKALGYFFLNKLDEAMETHLECQETLNEQPDSFLAIFNASMALRVALKKCEPAYFDYFSQILNLFSRKVDEKRYSLRTRGYRGLLLTQLGDKAGALEEWKKADELLPDVEMKWEVGQYFLLRGFGAILTSDQEAGTEFLQKAEAFLTQSGSPMPYIAELKIAKLFNDWQTNNIYSKGIVNIQNEITDAVSQLEELQADPKFSVVKNYFSEAILYCQSLLYGKSNKAGYKSSLIVTILINTTQTQKFAYHLTDFTRFSKVVNKILSLESFDVKSLKEALNEIIGFNVVVSRNRFQFTGKQHEEDYGTAKIIAFANKILELNEKLIEVNQYKSLALIGKEVAHDIQSPLAILKGTNFDFADKNSAKVFKSSVERIDNIVETLLSSSKNKRNKQPLIEVLKRAVLDKKTENSLVKFSDSFSLDSSLKVNVPDSIVLRILSNIFNNSIEAGATSINLKAESTASSVKVFINDNGSGFDTNFLKHISTSSEAFTTKFSGQGIGLSSARKYLQDFGGAIRLENQGGALVILDLPLISKAQLIVHLDDDKYISKMWMDNCSKRNLNLLSFNKLEAFEEKLDTIPFDAIIFLDDDLHGHKGAGKNLSIKMNQLGYRNIYLSTGHTSEDYADLNFLKGVLGKSFPEEVLNFY